MADDITTLTVLDAVLKDNQTARAATVQYDRTCELPSKVGIGTGEWQELTGGRRWVQPLATEPMTAYTRNVSDARADASVEQYKQAIYNPTAYIEAPIHFNFDAEARAGGTGPSEAFIQMVSKKISGAIEAIGAETARQTLNSDGLATLCGAAITTGALNANVITLTDANWERVMKRDYIVIGTKLDIASATASVASTTAAPLYTNRKVTAITPSTSADSSTITLDGPAMATAADGTVTLHIAGNRVWNGTAIEVREITGLPTIMDNTTSTTVGSLTGANTARWMGNVISYGGVGSTTNTAFSTAMYMAQLEQITARVGNQTIYSFCDQIRFNHVSVILANSTNQAVRYGGTDQIEAKFRQEIPMPGGTTLVCEPQAAPNEIQMVSLGHLEYLYPRGKKTEWVEQSGGSYVKWDDNHGRVGMAMSNVDLCTDMRAGHSRGRYVL